MDFAASADDRVKIKWNKKRDKYLDLTRELKYYVTWLHHLTLDPYLIMMLSVNQSDIKYHFLSLWYDSIWDWTPTNRAIVEQELFLIMFVSWSYNF